MIGWPDSWRLPKRSAPTAIAGSGDALGAALSEPIQATRKSVFSGVPLLALGGFLVLIALVVKELSHVPSPSEPTTIRAFFSLELLIGLLKEVGFAFLIAWGVAITIERKAHERDLKNAASERSRIAENVVQAVYGLQHDRRYVRTVIERSLQPPVVRERYKVKMTIDALSPEELDKIGVSDPKRFVKLHQLSRYRFLNVSHQEVSHVMGYGLPVRSKKELRDFARVLQVKLDGVSLTQAEIDEALQPDDGDPSKNYKWERKIAPQGHIDVLVESMSVKEFSDNEVWRNYHPTIRGMELEAKINIPDMVKGLRALTSSPASELWNVDMTHDTSWTIEGPILPNESVVFWWRSKEDDGTAAS